MEFPKPRQVVPRLSRRRKLRATQIAALVSVAVATAALAVPELARAVAAGEISVPEPWRTILAIVLSSAATAIAMHRTSGGDHATGE